MDELWNVRFEIKFLAKYDTKVLSRWFDIVGEGAAVTSVKLTGPNTWTSKVGCLGLKEQLCIA